MGEERLLSLAETFAQPQIKRKRAQFSKYPVVSGMILGLRPANERRRYFVTTSLIGWGQA